MSAGRTRIARGTDGVAVNEGDGVNVSVETGADVAGVCALFPQALITAIVKLNRRIDRKRTVFLQVGNAGIIHVPPGDKKRPTLLHGSGMEKTGLTSL
jgi:hypothetical protein